MEKMIVEVPFPWGWRYDGKVYEYQQYSTDEAIERQGKYFYRGQYYDCPDASRLKEEMLGFSINMYKANVYCNAFFDLREFIPWYVKERNLHTYGEGDWCVRFNLGFGWKLGMAAFILWNIKGAIRDFGPDLKRVVRSALIDNNNKDIEALLTYIIDYTAIYKNARPLNGYLGEYFSHIGPEKFVHPITDEGKEIVKVLEVQLKEKMKSLDERYNSMTQEEKDLLFG